MNQTASTKALRSTAAALALAATCLFSSASLHAQAPAPGTPAPAPGTAPIPSTSTSVAAPGTKAATAGGAAALEQAAITPYDNRWDIYGGMLLMNGQAGQNLPKRYVMGGGEALGVYWLPALWKIPSNHLGLAVDYRIGAGTTPVSPNAFNLNRILVYQNIFSGGFEYRGPKNRYAGIDFQLLAGATHGTFDTAITGYPQGLPQEPTTGIVGIYTNRTSPWIAAGGSIDFNYSPKVAIRMQPDLILEHFGTENRYFFTLSAGLVYRIGHLKPQ